MDYTYPYPHPAVTVDVCLFTILDDQLKILLIKRGLELYKGDWALPGGFVQIDENLDQAVQRELEEETGAKGFNFEQFATFGQVDRDPRERVISVDYFALAPAEHVLLTAATDADEAAWFSIDELPDLAFDHAGIINKAVKRIRVDINNSTTAFDFLSKKFTISDVRRVFECVQGHPIDKRNFQKQLLAGKLIRPLGEKRKGSHRPAELYELQPATGKNSRRS